MVLAPAAVRRCDARARRAGAGRGAERAQKREEAGGGHRRRRDPSTAPARAGERARVERCAETQLCIAFVLEAIRTVRT